MVTLKERTFSTELQPSGLPYHFFFFSSLSRFTVVPQKVLDTELKKTFAHFNDGRIPVSINQTPRRACARSYGASA